MSSNVRLQRRRLVVEHEQLAHGAKPICPSSSNSARASSATTFNPARASRQSAVPRPGADDHGINRFSLTKTSHVGRFENGHGSDERGAQQPIKTAGRIFLVCHPQRNADGQGADSK